MSPCRRAGDPANENDLAWSPDGLRLAFTRGGDIFVQNVSGVGEPTALVESGGNHIEDWSKDGQYLVFGSGDDRNLYGLSIEGDGNSFPIVQSPFVKDEAAFSPDSRWLAYNSNESGTDQVYVTSFPGPGERRQVSTSGGMAPKWRGDGRELYYLDANGSLVAVAVDVIDVSDAAGRLDFGPPQVLFDTGLNPSNNTDQFAVTADGQRFLIRLPLAEATPTPITVVLNWMSTLGRR